MHEKSLWKLQNEQKDVGIWTKNLVQDIHDYSSELKANKVDLE
jgi:hypothetical protein